MEPMQEEYRQGKIHFMLRERTHQPRDKLFQDGTKNHEITGEERESFMYDATPKVIISYRNE